MNRAPSTPGRVAFVGSGPGDPGLLTVRARDALAGAPLVVTDPDVPDGVLALVADGAEVRPAVGEPADVAAGLIAEATAGRPVVRLVAGDLLTADAVVAETVAVAAAGCRSTSSRASPPAPPCRPTPVSRSARAHTEADVPRRGRLGGARRRDPARSCCTPPSAHLADIVARPDRARRRRRHAGRRDLRRHPDRAEDRADHPRDAGRRGGDLDGPLVVTVGGRRRQRDRLSWWESRALYGWRVLVPHTKDQAGEMIDRLAHARRHRRRRCRPSPSSRRARPAQMERAVKGLVDGRYQWVVFTSTNAVRAVWEKFAEFGLDARAFSGVRIACVDARPATRCARSASCPS